MNRFIVIFFITILTAASYSVRAIPFTFDYTATHVDAPYDFSGFVTIDTLYTEGTHDVFNDISAYHFEWTDGVETFSVSTIDKPLFDDEEFKLFLVDFDLWVVDDWKLCTGECNPDDPPELITDLGGVDATLGVGTTINGMYEIGEEVRWQQQWTHREAQVPEPASIALLASGLLGFGATRRPNKQA